MKLGSTICSDTKTDHTWSLLQYDIGMHVADYPNPNPQIWLLPATE